GLLAPRGSGICQKGSLVLSQITRDVAHVTADRLIDAPYGKPGLGISHKFHIRRYFIPASGGQDGEGDAACTKIGRIAQMPGRRGAPGALSVMRGAVMPHVFIHQELVPALKKVDHRYESVAPGDACGCVELRHRQASSGCGDRVALARMGLFLGKKFSASLLPRGVIDNRWPAGLEGVHWHS